MSLRRFFSSCGFLMVAANAWAQAAPEVASAPAETAKKPSEAVDLLERFVGWLHGFFPAINEELFHWIACLVVILAAILLRHLVTNIIFSQLKKLAARTETTLDDKLFPALESPVATLVMVCGIFAALTVLKPSFLDRYIHYGAQVAITAVILWGLMCAGGAIIDHVEEISHAKGLGVAAFMPLIKKTLAVLFAIFGLLVIIQGLGADVKAFLAGLGIGGLAFALAAQDTIANLFGSFVVVIDQPFRVGEVVRIGANEGKVEDIGLRSTKIRTGARTLIVIPNKSVASEAITNLSRMPQRRVDLTVGLTYDTSPAQMQEILGDIRKILQAEEGIEQQSMTANFVNFAPSSLDIQIIYYVTNPDWARHLELRERVNLKIMQAVSARGLSFAFPTQTLHFEGEVARRLAGAKPAQT